MKGNAIIGQAGGPTSVINSSLAGVIAECKAAGLVENVYGMHFGLMGFLEERLLDLSSQSADVLAGLRSTPSSALGCSRHKVKDEELPIILELFERYDIRYFFYTGGNDSMDTVNRIERYCNERHYELAGIGIPKTVDNDLFYTDHTPGFPSAGRANMLNVRQSGWHYRDMQRVEQFVIYQTIGRDSGWLAASTALGKTREEEAPHLIYMPERVFDDDAFLRDAQACIGKYGWVSVVCSEGLRYADGNPVSGGVSRDNFYNTEFGAKGGVSVGFNLHKLLARATGLRGEFQVPESLIMCSIDRAMKLDLDEAFECGRQAVRLAARGESGCMVCMERVSNDPYSIRFGKAALADVALHFKPMPESFIDASGTFVTAECLDYMRPLLGEVPAYVTLEKKFARKTAAA
ncbi:MAG TPA: diphosphate--fructose-6-phosphate 1-phosphotransferase [Fibrobacteria bacterium]|nr:diphosphate--fructose-6-phosphate 1-phosphotransferase [Fibrobacteria bacterium]